MAAMTAETTSTPATSSGLSSVPNSPMPVSRTVGGAQLTTAFPTATTGPALPGRHASGWAAAAARAGRGSREHATRLRRRGQRARRRHVGGRGGAATGSPPPLCVTAAPAVEGNDGTGSGESARTGVQAARLPLHGLDERAGATSGWLCQGDVAGSVAYRDEHHQDGRLLAAPACRPNVLKRDLTTCSTAFRLRCRSSQIAW